MKVSTLGELHLQMLNSILGKKYVIFQEDGEDIVPLVEAEAVQQGENLIIKDKLGFFKNISGIDQIFLSENNFSVHAADFSSNFSVASLATPKAVSSVYLTKLQRRYIGNVLSQETNLGELEEKVPSEVVHGILDFLGKQDFDSAMDSFQTEIKKYPINISVNLKDEDDLLANPSMAISATITIRIPSVKIKCVGNNLKDVLLELYGDLVEIGKRAENP